MKILLALVTVWLAANTDLPISFDLPKVRFAPATQIAAMKFPNVTSARRPRVVAVYDDKARTILLQENWTVWSVADLSVLVHETVHHLQNIFRLGYECPAARELPSYQAQDRFLRMFGRSLQSEFKLNQMTIKLRTICLPHK